MNKPRRYPWPCSALTREDMRLLFQLRESGIQRVPISRLIALAVRQTYGQLTENQTETENQDQTGRMIVLPASNQQQEKAA